MQKSRLVVCRAGLGFIFGDILHNIRYVAMKDSTKHLNRMRTDALIALQACDLSRADMKGFYESILCNTFLSHGFPKSFVRNHLCKHPLSTCILSECGL